MQNINSYNSLLAFFRFCLYAQLIWQVFGKEQQVYLTLDRTEWKQRGVWIQVLMLGIVRRSERPTEGTTFHTRSA
ncbi:hypothetical protein QNI16_10400 [Cytophagaceae bacterium YF14B1]|uniref:Uncharacterized protein n=1 Tax=Xanthocytophaga flava TaxID=3048013 RepID=A0AAE3QK76_9BACT|nr:hypothetical protein [Xanthocytophaga flavus]MDJ1480892.1 hypothetical protein [Xanthocytophaga flavus]